VYVRGFTSTPFLSLWTCVGEGLKRSMLRAALNADGEPLDCENPMPPRRAAARAATLGAVGGLGRVGADRWAAIVY